MRSIDQELLEFETIGATGGGRTATGTLTRGTADGSGGRTLTNPFTGKEYGTGSGTITNPFTGREYETGRTSTPTTRSREQGTTGSGRTATPRDPGTLTQPRGGRSSDSRLFHQTGPIHSGGGGGGMAGGVPGSGPAFLSGFGMNLDEPGSQQLILIIAVIVAAIIYMK